MIVTTTKRNMHAYMAPDGTIDRTTVLCGLCFEHLPNRQAIYHRLKEAKQTGDATDPNNNMFDITGWAETRDNPPRCIKCQYDPVSPTCLGDPIDYPVYGDPDYQRAIPGMYAFLPWDSKPYSGRLVWVAPDETIDEATEVCDIDGISPEDARNLVSILNEGLKLLVERDNQPLPFASGPVDWPNRGVRLVNCRACGEEFKTTIGDKRVVDPICEKLGKHWCFTPVHDINPDAVRPYGVQLHDLRYPERKAIWSIWTFTKDDQETLLEVYERDPLGVVDALRHIELQDDDGEPSLFE